MLSLINNYLFIGLRRSIPCSFHNSFVLTNSYNTASEEKNNEPTPKNSLWFTTLPEKKKKPGRKFRRKLDMKPKPKRGRILISCKRQELNHYSGQVYGKFDVIPLASKGWFSSKSFGDHFTIHLSDKHPAFFSGEDCIPPSFTELGIDEKLVDGLKKMKVESPTKIQAIAIPKMLKGLNTFITAETGCGKTLAYLLPTIHKLMRWTDSIQRLPFNSPLAVVLVPHRELAYQVGAVATQLCTEMNLKCKVIVGGHTKSQIRQTQFEEIHLLVATLGVVQKMFAAKLLSADMCKQLVLDESDSLFDDSFSEDTLHFVKKFAIINKGPPSPEELPIGTQISLVSATTPKSLSEIVNDAFPLESLVHAQTNFVHKIQPHVPQTFMRVSKNDKEVALLKVVRGSVAQKLPTIIFSNKSSTCDWISLFLNENGIKCTHFNSKMGVDLREGKLRDFKEGLVDVISCTDIASRGVDTIQAQHVINFDFPMYMADYIHRCGRTGRVGAVSGPCKVTSFVAGKREISLLHAIETAARRSEDLPNVNANITRILYHKHLKRTERPEPPPVPDQQ